ncbi:MAG: hypothetical protein LBI53_02300 [Candidatus Peribacteria bacterium]|jgi:hypothetical protein|nr:hypothetical protein [Candidatus Peribacteria bacterium]
MPKTNVNIKLSDFCHGDSTGETYQNRIQRNQNYLKFINQTYPTNTIITVSHG